MLTRSWVLSAVGLWLSCSTTRQASTAAGDAPAQAAAGFVKCEERPQVCTHQYRPVCGRADTGIKCIEAPCPSSEERTYPNGCAACADPKVSGYVAGACGAAGGEVH